jgi:hypothetical protein
VVDERHRRDGEAAPEGDVDRAAILARRRRFILMALGGLSGVGGCRQVEPPPNPLEAIEAASSRPPYEQVRLPPPAVVAIEELDEELDEEQRTELAKALYERAKQAEAEGDLVGAIELFEAAYYQVPGKHRMALHVGELAATVGDCEKARDYLEHFVLYADHDKRPDQHERAQALLHTPELRSCERPPLTPSEDAEPMPCLTLARPDPEPPEPPPESKRKRRGRGRK